MNIDALKITDINILTKNFLVWKHENRLIKIDEDSDMSLSKQLSVHFWDNLEPSFLIVDDKLFAYTDIPESCIYEWGDDVHIVSFDNKRKKKTIYVVSDNEIKEQGTMYQQEILLLLHDFYKPIEIGAMPS